HPAAPRSEPRDPPRDRRAEGEPALLEKWGQTRLIKKSGSDPLFQRTANTQTTPPCGTMVSWPKKPSTRRCEPTASTPQPACTATYCVPSTSNVTGTPITPEFSRRCHSTSPVSASNARNQRSAVPPVNT